MATASHSGGGRRRVESRLDGMDEDRLIQLLMMRRDANDYANTSPAPAGTLNLDLKRGSVFEVILTENVTSLILARTLAAGRAGPCSIIPRQDATGGGIVVWPSAIKWPGGSAPNIKSAASAVDVYALITTCMLDHDTCML